MDGNFSPEIKEYIKGHESCQLIAYVDSLGFPTIGWGHLMIKRTFEEITQDQADQLFDQDLCEANLFLCHLYPELPEVSPNRKMALLDMAFQLRGNLTHFPRALQHLRTGEWSLAAADFLDSIWARRQTPSRAIDNAILLIQG